ncbi:MAG: D-alanine-D-alanine ligase [Parcubacteria group bacterium GW2011_GWA2_43_9b]|nr:MAG: D-alanine-D-alanine ligase [Parcubacteria group bacterium GW2011_GWA2_43_9b]
MDKDATKKALKNEKILMPRHIILDKSYKPSDLKRIRTPLVVKPVDQGSSIATFIVKKEKELSGAIKEALKISSRVMVEEFIDGREVTAAVLGNKNPVALPLIEIRPKKAFFFDYQSKYEISGSEEICPALISRALTKEIQAVAIKIHKILSCRGVTRSDFIIKNNKPYFLEINTIPGMTETSLVPLAAAKHSLSFSELLDELIKLAFEG